MPRKKIKDQHINFVVKKRGDMMSVDMSFFPKLAQSEEAFNALPIEQREINNMAAKIGKHVMEALAKESTNG